MALTAPSSFLFYTAKCKDAALNAQLSSLLVIIKCIVLLREKNAYTVISVPLYVT